MSLDSYEKELLESFEKNDQMINQLDDRELEKYSDYASKTLKKDKRVNIRMSEHDLEAIRRRAVQEGLPYQTLISSLIHKYTTGMLVEKKHAG